VISHARERPFSIRGHKLSNFDALQSYVASNVLGRGTFEQRIDTHDGAMIVTQTFVSSTTPSCSGTGVDAGVRTGIVGSSKALPSPVPLGPDS
jgi:hypothetical protein